MKTYLIGALGIGMLAILASCAPINEDECRAGNWGQIGLQDGKNGALPSRFSTYVEECAQYGITPDRTAWLAGREQGLLTYCTPHSAYLTGKRGRGLADVCPNPQALIVPNRVGLRYHEIDERIDDLDDRADDIKKDIRNLFSGEITEKEYYLRRRYLDLLDDIEDDIDDLKDERRDLPVF